MLRLFLLSGGKTLQLTSVAKALTTLTALRNFIVAIHLPVGCERRSPSGVEYLESVLFPIDLPAMTHKSPPRALT